jgi:hypothetical protein
VRQEQRGVLQAVAQVVAGALAALGRAQDLLVLAHLDAQRGAGHGRLTRIDLEDGHGQALVAEQLADGHLGFDHVASCLGFHPLSSRSW